MAGAGRCDRYALHSLYLGAQAETPARGRGFWSCGAVKRQVLHLKAARRSQR